MSAVGPLAPISVVFCDDYDLFRRGLAEMSNIPDGIEVAGKENTHERASANGWILQGRRGRPA